MNIKDNISLIACRWETIQQRIKAVQDASLLAAPRIKLVAVSKAQAVEAVCALLEAGCRDFGENRVQDAMVKWPKLRAQYPDVRLHLIGALQTNKVKEALTLFDVMHTIDRVALVDAIARVQHTLPDMRCREFFLQVNTGEEVQKGGVAPSEADSLLRYCQAHSLPVTGLMCIPPADVPPAPHFALLHKMAQDFGIPHLSMGMSGDYETAIRLGATHVRLGTALFGARNQEGA